MAPAFMLEQLTFIELDPLHFLEVAAMAGYDGIGLHLQGLSFPRAAQYDLIADIALRRDFAEQLAASGLRIHVIEPFLVTPEVERDALRRNLDIAAELGATCAGVLSFDPDAERGAERLAQLDEDAAARGIALSIEPYFYSSLPTLSSALAAAHLAGSSAGVTLDVLHVVRGGEHWARMASIEPERVRTIQLSDGPMQPPDDRAFEAISDRAVPGEGAFDLATLIPHLPQGMPIGIEVPSISLAKTMDPVVRAIFLRKRTARLFA